ncbi:hypothetical protein ACFU0X_20620 [Streptomyces cellulosae]|uniref:Uncharacterized protein n=1 Tax=Streptomyces cellulosae TaxID=1968 RepID=A0ABW6JK49_STRCE
MTERQTVLATAVMLRLAGPQHRVPLDLARRAALHVVRGEHAGDHHAAAVQARDDIEEDLLRGTRALTALFDRMREQLQRLQPSVTRTMEALAAALKHLPPPHAAASSRGQRPRPAWQSPYGPAHQRRH